jgi:L-asparaginase/Glu-tRNA(Gln) amidotransferase subunit D
MRERATDERRPVRLIAVGGTIAMRGDRAVPVLDAAALVADLPQLPSLGELEAETAMTVPGAHLSLAQALDIANRACAAAARGEGVVLTAGTDTLEELAVLCAICHDGDAPIVLTGANRPASVVVFGGEIHAAMTVRKLDSTGPAFGSPVLLTCRPERSAMLFDTYGFAGSERDLRDSGAICVPFLSPQAARIALLCCLGAGLRREQIAHALAPWDAGPAGQQHE